MIPCSPLPPARSWSTDEDSLLSSNSIQNNRMSVCGGGGFKRPRSPATVNYSLTSPAQVIQPDSAATATAALSLNNPYHILQVRRDATPSEIRQAYKRLALWHHPARRRNIEASSDQQKFVILAACYETLTDNDARHQFDVLLQKQFRGKVLVGGKPWSSTQHRLSSTPTTVATPLVVDLPQPRFEPIFSNVTHELLHHDTDGVPTLVTSMSLDYDDDDDSDDSSSLQSGSCYDDDDTTGFAMLRQARNYRPFTDPFDVFDKVFGSRLYPHVPLSNQPSSSAPPKRKSLLKNAAWTGSTRTLPDGTLISTTTRILHNRQLTRVERIIGGTTHVSVVAEELERDDDTNDHQKRASWQNIMDSILCGSCG